MSTLRSKEEPWSYIYHGDYDINQIKNMINNLNEEWTKDVSRQKVYQTHRDTECITIIKMSYAWIKGHEVQVITDKDFLDLETKKSIEYIISDLENKINGKAVRFEIVNMKPYSRIRTHKDRTDINYLARRIHIPVITNENVLFKVDNVPMHMKAGQAYEINNIKWHSVYNNSEYNRVHLIIDILPIEFYFDDDKNDKINIKYHCQFCTTSWICEGPHIEQRDSASFLEYLYYAKEDHAYSCIEEIEKYERKNNIKLDDLKNSVFSKIMERDR